MASSKNTRPAPALKVRAFGQTLGRVDITASEAFDKQNVKTVRGPFDHAAETLAATTNLAQRVNNLATKLVAHYPAPRQNATDDGSGSVLSNLDLQCLSADEGIAEAHMALDAIESALP